MRIAIEEEALEQAITDCEVLIHRITTMKGVLMGVRDGMYDLEVALRFFEPVKTEEPEINAIKFHLASYLID